MVALAFCATGCPKVKPSAYELGLKAYYQALLSETTEASLGEAIAGLDKELEKSPADPGLLALRASGSLELLRLGVQKPAGIFETAHAASLFRDLRLLQNLVDQAATKPWFRARVSTMAGDAFLLRAESLPEREGSRSILLRSIRQAALYQLARDFYQHAWTAAKTEETDQQGAEESAVANRTALQQEKGNARDGYVSAVAGLAQTRRILGFPQKALVLTTEVIRLLGSAAEELPAAAGLTPKSLYAYTHRLLQTQYQSMGTLTTDNFAQRVGYAESELKEEFASKLLRSDPADLSFGDEEAAGGLLTHYATSTARAESVDLTGAGDPSTERLSFKLLPGQRYATAGVNASVPSLTLATGADQPGTSVPFPRRGRRVPPEGVEVTIQSGKGENQALTFFLGRTQALLPRGWKCK